MARQRKKEEFRPAAISLEEMPLFIEKIDRRLADLSAFDVNQINDSFDPNLKALETKLLTLIDRVYPVGTIESEQFKSKVCELDYVSWVIPDSTSTLDKRRRIKENINISIAQLNSIKEGFEEELEDAGRGKSARPLRAYEALELHPEIERAAGQLFRDGHYSNAVEDAVKALNALVRLRSGVDDKDGVKLMQAVFSAKAPILKFNDLNDESDANEQKGFMDLYCGAVTGLRNPRAHKILTDSSEEALEFISFISLLAKLCDKAKR